jgi:hypothetical protein
MFQPGLTGSKRSSPSGTGQFPLPAKIKEKNMLIKPASRIYIIFGKGQLQVQPAMTVVQDKGTLQFELIDLDSPGIESGKTVEIESACGWLNGPATKTFTPAGYDWELCKYTVKLIESDNLVGMLDPEVIIKK